jgi:hypothetical protein
MRKLSCKLSLKQTLINVELVETLMRIDDFRYARGNIQSTLTQLFFSFDRATRETSQANSRLPTVMQTLASKLSSILYCMKDIFYCLMISGYSTLIVLERLLIETRQYIEEG